MRPIAPKEVDSVGTIPKNDDLMTEADPTQRDER